MKMAKQKGQVALEYLILFVMLALMTVVSLSSFYPKVQEIIIEGSEDTPGLSKTAIERIVK